MIIFLTVIMVLGFITFATLCAILILFILDKITTRIQRKRIRYIRPAPYTDF